MTALTTSIARTTWSNKVFEVSLYERPGYVTQIHLTTCNVVADPPYVIPRQTIALRAGPAAAIGAALLRAVDAAHARHPANVTAAATDEAAK